MQLSTSSTDGAWPLRRRRETEIAAHDRAPSEQTASPAGALFSRVRSAALGEFSKTVFHKVGMRAIARGAGTGMAGLYEIAETKERLLTTCLAPDFEARTERLAAASRREVSARARLRACVIELVRFDLERPDFARIVRLHAPAELLSDVRLANRSELEIARIVDRGVRDGSIRNDLTADAITGLICAQIDGALARWAREDARLELHPDGEALVEARAGLLWSLIWPAISSA